MKNKLFSLYEILVLRRPLVTLVVTLLLIGWLGTHIPNFRLDASADSLVLEGDEDLEYFREISKRYASEDFLLVTYSPHGELFSRPVLDRIEQLRTDLAAVEGVSSVVTILDIPLLQSPPATLEQVADGTGIRSLRDPDIDFELVREELRTSPVYEDLLTSKDGRTTALQVNLQRDEHYFKLLRERDELRELANQRHLTQAEHIQLKQAEQVFRDYAFAASERQSALVDSVRGILDNYRDDAQVFLGGVPMIAADMITFVKNDLVTFGAGIIIFIVVTMTVIFRRFAWVALPLLTCLLSATFMLGLITWMDWRMTVISSNFVALLLIITLSITIHLVVRYRELLSERSDLSQRELVRQTAYLMAKPCIYTALTTVVAFASLVFSGIRPVIDFGWMMTIGVSVALALAFIILPTTMSLLKKPDMSSARENAESTTVHFAAFTEKHGKLILVASTLLTVLSIWGITRLEVENRFIDYFHESTEIYQGMEVIDAKLGGTIPLVVIIDPPKEEQKTAAPAVSVAVDSASQQVDADIEFGGGFDDFEDDFGDEASVDASYWFNRAGLARIEEVHDYLDSLGETGKVLSIATFYKLLRQLTSGIDDIQLALIQQKLPDGIGDILVKPYLNEELDQIRISVRVMETSHTLKRDQLLKDIRHHLVDELGFEAGQVHLSGMLVLYNNMLQSLYKSQILTLGVVFVAIVLMFLVLFRSISIALIAITPNLLAAGIVLGGMGLVGIPLDIMTVTIAAITVGIAVDDTIHYVHRFQAEFPRDRNYIATMYRCHRSIGQAMYYTSITIIIGFSILALSNFNPSIFFGLLTGVAMFAALLGALLLLPQLMITFKPLGPNQEVDTHQA